MKHEIVIQLYLKRIKGVQEVRDRCKKDSWGYNYWNSVLTSLIGTLDSYLVEEGIFE